MTTTPATGLDHGVRSSLPEAPNLVGGRRVRGERYEIRDPGHRSQVVGAAYAAQPATVDAAVTAAEAAAPGWAGTPLEDRIAALVRARDGLVEVATHAGWPELLTSEQGKVVAESTFEVGRAPALIDLFAPLARAALAVDVLDDERGHREVAQHPIGPVAAIAPWNWPVSLSLGKIVPALLAGNPVVLKPAPNTPLTVTAITSALAEHLPPGVLGVLHGGSDVGTALVQHAGIGKVVFTGSTANGARVYASAAATIKNITLELGGNDPALVLDDADLSEETLGSMISSTFVTSGQVCWAIKRIYVHRSRHAEFVNAFRDAADELVLGHGLDPAATMGPVNNEVQLGIVTDLVARAERDGGSVMRLGRRVGDTDVQTGNYHAPTVVTDVDDRCDLVRTEQFGPAVPILAFDDVNEAVRRANDSPFGLCASVWSSDRDRAFSVARRLRAGQVYINAHAGAALDYTRGFGGVGQSGIGREMGVEGVRAYTDLRLVSDRILR
jgi:aldehyde dehydrogenase